MKDLSKNRKKLKKRFSKKIGKDGKKK